MVMYTGSVSDFLVNHAHCPVTVCRTGAPRQRMGSDAAQRKSRHTSGESIKNFVSSVFHGNRPSSRTQSIASDTEWFVINATCIINTLLDIRRLLFRMFNFIFKFYDFD